MPPTSGTPTGTPSTSGTPTGTPSTSGTPTGTPSTSGTPTVKPTLPTQVTIAADVAKVIDATKHAGAYPYQWSAADLVALTVAQQQAGAINKKGSHATLEGAPWYVQMVSTALSSTDAAVVNALPGKTVHGYWDFSPINLLTGDKWTGFGQSSSEQVKVYLDTLQPGNATGLTVGLVGTDGKVTAIALSKDAEGKYYFIAPHFSKYLVYSTASSSPNNSTSSSNTSTSPRNTTSNWYNNSNRSTNQSANSANNSYYGPLSGSGIQGASAFSSEYRHTITGVDGVLLVVGSAMATGGALIVSGRNRNGAYRRTR